MKHLMRVVAIAVAASFAAFGVPPASAIDAHHPATGATKGKKAKKLAPKTKTKSTKSARMQMMNCPMMGGNMMQGGMMQGGMMKGHMTKGRMMKCRMMSSASMHAMGMKQGMGPGMMNRAAMHNAMNRGEPMMGHANPCWVMIDRERGYGYSGACNH